MMKNWIHDNSRMIKMLLILGNILIFVHFHIVHIQDAIVAILLLSIPLALCFGFLTNLFVPSGSRRDFYRSRNSDDYGE